MKEKKNLLNKLYTVVLITVFIFGGLQNNFAQLLLDENFDYATGTALTANGWSAHSSAGTNPITVTAPTISYTGYVSSGIANEVSMTNTGEDINKPLSSIVTSGVVYSSFLVNISAVAGTTGDYFFHFKASSTSSYKARIFVKKDATNIYFGAMKSSGGVAGYITTPYSYNTTYLVVVKYTFNTASTTDDVVDLFINPAINGVEPTPDFSVSTNTDADTISYVALRQGSSAQAPTLKLDGIRVGRTWTDILPFGNLPSIIITDSLNSFGSQEINTISAEQIYFVSGSNLTADINITAPDGFEISTTSGSGFAGNITIPQTGGIVDSALIYVRFHPTIVQIYSGNITHTSAGAYDVLLPVSGIGGTTPIVETPTFNPAEGTYNTSQTVTISCATPNARIFYTTNGNTPDSLTATEYLGSAINVAQTTTIKAIAYKTGMITSSVASATYTINLGYIDVPNLAALRTQNADNLTVYRVTGQVVLTFKQAFRNQKFIQDSSAAILIDDMNSVITSTYNIGDGLTNIRGKLTVYGNMLQFVPTLDPGAATSTGNVVNPRTITVNQMLTNFDNFESQLVKLENVFFPIANNDTTFANGKVYSLVQNSDTAKFRTTFYDVNYINLVIPSGLFNLYGILNARTDGNYITARDTNDYEEINVNAVATPTFNPPAGTYSTPQSVNLTCSTPNARIYYTTNGNTPDSLTATEYLGNAINVTQTTTIKAIAYKTGMIPSNIASATYTINIVQIISIHDIQYTTAPSGDSPFNNQIVTTTGIVTGVKNGTSKAYFIQNGIGQWNGIYVYDNQHFPAIGDSVVLTGLVAEYNGLTEIKNVSAFNIAASNKPVPAPTVITLSQMGESYEGVLIKVNDVLCVNDSAGFGTWIVSSGMDSLTIDDDLYAFNPTINTSYNITGLGYFSYAVYKILPRDMNDISIAINVNKNYTNNIEITPNPSNGFFKLNLNDNSVYDISIYNLLGKCIYSINNIEKTHMFDLSSFDRGIYIINIKNKLNKQIITKKLVIK